MIQSCKKLFFALIVISTVSVQASQDVSSGPNFLGKFVLQNYGKLFGASMALFAASAAIGRFERPFVTEMNNLQRLKKNIETSISLRKKINANGKQLAKIYTTSSDIDFFKELLGNESTEIKKRIEKEDKELIQANRGIHL